MQDSVVSHLLLQARGTQESWLDEHFSSLSIISFYCPSLYFTPFLSFPLVYFCSCSLYLSFFYPCRLFPQHKDGTRRDLAAIPVTATTGCWDGDKWGSSGETFEAFDIKKGSAFLTQLVWYFHSLMWLRIWGFNVWSVNDSEQAPSSPAHLQIIQCLNAI